ncbi:MAG: single-stranded DNA-binding protein [Bacilli bacterium]
MLNQTVIVGRLVRNPELRKTEAGRKVTNITLAVPRSFKNHDGEYETDFIDCVLWKGIAESTTEYCKKGDMLGVKGRIQSRNIEASDGNRKTITEIVAEKVTFLSPNNKEE